MSVKRNRKWLEIDSVLHNIDGLPGVISKLEIGDHDLYVQTAWYKGKIVYIDATLSRGRGDDGLPISERQATLETTRYDLARSWLESSCHMASTMLQTGEVDIGDIIEEWNGMEGYPQGYCKQLPATNEQTGESGPTFQRGPLHAVAKLLQRRVDYWREFIESLTNDDDDGKE